MRTAFVVGVLAVVDGTLVVLSVRFGWHRRVRRALARNWPRTAAGIALGYVAANIVGVSMLLVLSGTVPGPDRRPIDVPLEEADMRIASAAFVLIVMALGGVLGHASGRRKERRERCQEAEAQG